MGGKPSSTQFINRNRKPWVHIHYDVAIGSAQEKRELPFVMGVLADLSGDNADKLKPVHERTFDEIDARSFDRYMESASPRLVMEVTNTLGAGDTSLPVDITFESMDDFSPPAIARKVEPLAKLLQDRSELKDLISRMHRKGAQELIGKLLHDRGLLEQLASGADTDPKS